MCSNQALLRIDCLGIALLAAGRQPQVPGCNRSPPPCLLRNDFDFVTSKDKKKKTRIMYYDLTRVLDSELDEADI